LGRAKESAHSSKQEKIGGIALYLSLIALLILSVSNLSAIITLIPTFNLSTLVNLITSLATIVFGFLLAIYSIPEKTFVFMHETKHAVISGLAGNRWKKMHIENDSGHFEYAYSKRTAHFNAMIALAPYFVPLLTVPALAMSAVAFYQYHRVMLVITCFAYGIDLFSNIRDIDPRQTDFSVIRGGFSVGLSYVALANILIFTLLITWCLFDLAGLKHLAVSFWHFVEKVIQWRLFLTKP
jgi:hypothetical protein